MQPTIPAPPHPTDATAAAATVRALVRANDDHEAYRASCIGLVPTENRMSALAQRMLGGDLSHRYLFQNPQ